MCEIILWNFPLFVGKISPNVGNIPPICDIVIIYFNLVICCFQFKHSNNVWNIFIMFSNLRNGKNYKFPFFVGKISPNVGKIPPIYDIVIIYFNLVICCFQFKHLNTVWNTCIMFSNLENETKLENFHFWGENTPLLLEKIPTFMLISLYSNLVICCFLIKTLE